MGIPWEMDLAKSSSKGKYSHLGPLLFSPHFPVVSLQTSVVEIEKAMPNG